MNILCAIGFHKWRYTPATYINYTSELLGITEKDATRTCEKCKRSQVQDIHCLGLNPPAYVKTWYDL